MSATRDLPRITFGIIVLNGEPFTRYCLRSLYPFAHEIIVVEGGHTAAVDVSTPDGHSTDATLEALYRFKEEEDPEDKLQIVVRDGHWPQKDELGNSKTPQCRAYAERATGDYLWQVDIDEFYRGADMRRVLSMLRDDPAITAVSFNVYPFWGGFEYVSDGWYWRRGKITFHRLFRWGPGYSYVTHQPPTVADERGRDLRALKWVSGDEMARRGIRLYHYDHVFPEQVRTKAAFYRRQSPRLSRAIDEWADAGFFSLRRPYNVERHYWLPAWIERYEGGPQPAEAVHLCEDAVTGALDVELRRNDDVERLLQSWHYRAGKAALKALDPVERSWRWGKLQAVRASHAPRKLAELAARRRPRPTGPGVATEGGATRAETAPQGGKR
jgi:hypothetical protein